MNKKILNIASWDDTRGTHFIDVYPTRPEVKKWDINKHNSKLPYEDNFFDEVLCFGFLEHSSNVGMLLQEIHRILKKRGKVRITTDNANYWVFANWNSVHRWGTLRNPGFYEDNHLSLFTDRHLFNLLRYYNFKPINLEYKYIKEFSGSIVRQTIKRVINTIFKHTFLNKFVYRGLNIDGIKKEEDERDEN